MIDVDAVDVQAGGVTLLGPTSVRVGAGEALIIRGRNGTGKSTLLRVLAGARRPSHGTARLAGSVIDGRDRMFRRRVSAMIGLPPMAPDLTVLEHLRLVAATWSAAPAAAATAHAAAAPADADPAATEPDAARAPAVEQALLEQLGLEHLTARFPHELSSGQTQLFGLALLLARPFDVLILDEPEQRLDPEHVDTVIRVLRARRDAGATVVAATHSSVLADALADQTLDLGTAA